MSNFDDQSAGDQRGAMDLLQAGRPAPEFSLARYAGDPLTRRDLEGVKTLFVFFPFAFSPVCTDQLSVYNDVLGEFTARGVTLYGVSCDSTWTQQAFKRQLGVDIEQLSDYFPQGRMSAAFGALQPGGFPYRALVLCGPDGVVRWSHQAPSTDLGDMPSAAFVLEAIDALEI